MSPEDLCFLPVHEASRLLSRGEISPVDLVTAYLDRIAASNDTVNGYITVLPDAALEAAKVAEGEILRGASLGPLHGIPYGLKDNMFTAGIRTTAASRLRWNWVPTQSAPIYESLQARGAILLGKHNTWEFGTGTGEVQADLPFPVARNPWNTAYFTGGSSSGTGASVAAGLASFGLGSDTGGSIRVPASANGLVGLKPTLGLVSQQGILPNSPSFDCAGPLVHCVRDAALVLQAIAGGPAASDPSLANVVVPDYSTGIDAGVKGMRIGFIRSFHERDTPADAEIGAALDKAADVFRSLGAEVVDIELPNSIQDYRACLRGIGQSESLALHWQDFRDHHAQMGKALRDKFLGALLVNGVDVFHATRWRSILVRNVTSLFESCDVLLSASALHLVPQLTDQVTMQQFVMGAANACFSVTGHPAMSIPAGFDRNGLPLSIQLVGDYFGEATLLRAAAAYESALALEMPRPAFIAGESTCVTELHGEVDLSLRPSKEVVIDRLRDLGMPAPNEALVERARYLAAQARSAMARLPREFPPEAYSAHAFRVLRP